MGKPTVLLSKDQILAADDIKTLDVDVSEWGGTVRLRAMTGTERDQLEASIVKQVGNSRRINTANFHARIVAMCAVGGDGAKLFDLDDVAKLGEKSSAALLRVANAAVKLSGVSEEDVQELAEGFGDAQSGGSTSGSR